MPIVQVRATLEGKTLTESTVDIPAMDTVLQKWLEPQWSSELLVYPPNYMGDITPEGWGTSASFLLNVADSGEQAEVIASSTSKEWPSIDELRRYDPERLRAFGATALIDSRNTHVFISSLLGGVVTYAKPLELTFLQGLFQETPVDLAG